MTALSAGASLLPDSLFVKVIARAHRRFEPELARIVASCPTHGTALDVGAWYGPWTYWLSRRVDSVIAFEPNPDVAQILEHTVRSNVKVIRAAASDHVGTATLTLPVGGRGTEGRASLEGLADSTRTVEVQTCRLDDLDVESVSLIKIDVEGHERATLAGAEQLIARTHPMLVVEIEEKHGGVAPTLEMLEAWGYKGQVLVDDRWVSLADFDLAAHQEQYWADAPPASYMATILRTKRHLVNNVVFLHASSQLRLA